MKLHSLNLVSESTTASPTPGIKISPKGPRYGSRDRFLDKATLFKFRNVSTMASATPGAKNSPRNGCGVGHVTAV